MSEASGDEAYSLACEGTTFRWPNAAADVLRDVSLSVRRGEIVSLIGPSGCGKTTLLKLLCGLMRPTGGRVSLGGEQVVAPGRRVGIVFQNAPLYPWLTVQANVEFGQKLANVPARERTERAAEVLQRVGLWQWRTAYPHELSGGMRQRVAVAQLVCNQSEFLLLDEPFGALDYQTRFEMQQFTTEVRQLFHPGILLVTHQIDEAILLSERVILLNSRPGRVEEVIRIDLPYPRDLTTEKFNSYRSHIISHLRVESQSTFER